MTKWSHKCWELTSDKNEDLMLKHRDGFLRCFCGRAFGKDYECVKGFRAALCELLVDLDLSFFPSEDLAKFDNIPKDLDRKISEIGKSMDTGMIWRQVIDELSNAPFRLFEIPKSKNVTIDLKPNVFVEWGYALAKENLEHIVVVSDEKEDVPFPSDLSNTFQIRGKDADTLVQNIAKYLEDHHPIFCANERFAKLWYESEKYEKDIWELLLPSGNREGYFSLGDIAQHLCERAKDNLPDANAKVYAFLGKYEEFIDKSPGKVRVYPAYASALCYFIKSKVKRFNRGTIGKID